ncbi:pyrroline-5-carboxylate reductase family protein [Fructilactobacillus sp. Tb1]|uniref:pyrroline-5-carboxylate reductase family protein n=1 Tax=Fructilactobacillus sp. Tb1 TaxID=3422304 RepID=UPI003D2E8487
MKIAVLGAGHMGSAMIRGLANKYDVNDIFVKGHRVSPRLLAFQKEIGFQVMENNDFSDMDMLIVATPAPVTLDALNDVTVGAKTIIVSAAQGVSAKGIKNIFPKNSVICMVPNIPVAVNAGCIAIEKGDTATPADAEKANEVLGSMGTLV